MSSILNPVNRFKHDNAREVASVIVNPASELLKFCLANPQLFDEKKRRQILRAYDNAITLRTVFDLLGMQADNIVNELKNRVSLLTDFNVNIYIDVLNNTFIQDKKWQVENSNLIDDLKKAIVETDAFCSKLSGIDHYEILKEETFGLIREVENFFRDDSDRFGYQGGGTHYFITRDFDRSIDDTVRLDSNAFKTHVLGNIAANLHKHAFVDPSRRDYKVRLTTKMEDGKLVLIIANNGAPFHDDVEKVFLEGYSDGNGKGIGLTSAKQYMDNYGCSIKMTANDNLEFPVSFILTFPR